MSAALLILDADPIRLSRLEQWFIRAGYRVTGVRHPRQALAAASFRQFQVAILAAEIPEISCSELERRLKQSQQYIRILNHSADAAAPAQWQSVRHGDCPNDPLYLAALEIAVEQALESLADHSSRFSDLEI